MDALVPTPRPLLTAFLVVALVHVVAVGLGADVVSCATKPFLVGLLLVWVVVASRPHVLRPLVAGLAFALAGDLLLDGSGTLLFLAGMGAFLAMQICYIRGFVDLGTLERLQGTPSVPVAFAALWIVLNVALGPSLGDLRWPILVYSLALTAMAATAWGTGCARIAAGGALFLVSDLLIGLDAAGTAVPASGVLVMATYCAAQYLITTGWVLRERWLQSHLVPAAHGAHSRG
jgi:uncharacterized membrane protein YhhN